MKKAVRQPSIGFQEVAYKFVDWSGFTRYWLEEHDARVSGQQNTEKFIAGLQQQWESSSRHDRKDVIALATQLSAQEEQYKLHNVLISVFDSAWEALTPRERSLLHTMHRQGLSRTSAIRELALELYCSESTVRRHYQKALKRFRMLLFGQ